MPDTTENLAGLLARLLLVLQDRGTLEDHHFAEVIYGGQIGGSISAEKLAGQIAAKLRG